MIHKNNFSENLLVLQGDSPDCIGGFRSNLCYTDLDCGWNRYCIEGVCTPDCDCADTRNSTCSGKELRRNSDVFADCFQPNLTQICL